MAGPGRKNLTVREGRDFITTFAFGEPGARKIEDLVITSSSTTATSATAEFTSADTGKKLVVIDGVGITDGTTMTYVSATQVTLSAAATATRSNVAAVVRGINCSAYTGHAAEWRNTEDAATAVATFTVDDSRAAVGIFEITLDAASTAAATRSGVWDWKVTGPNGDTNWIEGKVIFKKTVTE